MVDVADKRCTNCNSFRIHPCHREQHIDRLLCPCHDMSIDPNCLSLCHTLTGLLLHAIGREAHAITIMPYLPAECLISYSLHSHEASAIWCGYHCTVDLFTKNVNVCVCVLAPEWPIKAQVCCLQWRRLQEQRQQQHFHFQSRQ